MGFEPWSNCQSPPESDWSLPVVLWDGLLYHQLLLLNCRWSDFRENSLEAA